MKSLWLLLLLLICANTSSAQVNPANVAPPGVEILKIKWSKESRVDVREGRFSMDASTPPSSASVFDRNQDSHTSLREQSMRSVSAARPSLVRQRVRYVYSLKIRNNGEKTIRAVVWEHVFLDPGNHQETNRVLLRGYHKVSPNKSATLEGETIRPPARVVSVEGLQKDARSPFDEHVEIKCVMYADGSFWKDPASNERVCGSLNRLKRVYIRSGAQ